MGTTTKAEPTVGRNRARASDPENEFNEEREQQYDLLTAALIGAAVGAGITLLLRRGPSGRRPAGPLIRYAGDRKSTRLNSSHSQISYAVFCLKKKNQI